MSTSIDDLLSFAEEPAEEAGNSGGGWLRGVLRILAVTAAIVVVVVVGLRAVGLQVSLWIIAAGAPARR